MTRTLLPQIPAFFPEQITRLLKGAALYDSSCSRKARVYFADTDGGLYIKTAEAGSLKTEAVMTKYFHRLGLSAAVVLYKNEGGRDWLVTERIPGEDCTHPDCLRHPEKLCETTALLLRGLHEQRGADCPVDRIQSYTASVLRGFEARHFGQDLFRDLWRFSSFEEAMRTAKEGLPTLRRECLLHGDYCLPNIILRGWKLSGYIDLGTGGLGDRHIDVLWGIWTLNYNLKTASYTDRFLDAYGRDAINPEKLRAAAAMEMIGV